jgi:hypothetical protein
MSRQLFGFELDRETAVQSVKPDHTADGAIRGLLSYAVADQNSPLNS